MAEAANVRLVRCPKCENLLPELPDFSLYRCGGCGAVLKAKKKGVPEDGLSEVSDDGRGSGIAEGVGIVNGSEVDMERTDGSENGRSPRVHNEKGACGSSSLAPAENREVQTDNNSTRAGKERIRRPEGFDDEYSSRSQGLVRIRNPGKNSELNADRPEYSNFRGQHVIEEIRPPVEPLRSRPLMDQLGVKSNGSTTSGPAGSLASQGRTGNFLYHDEGSSSYGMSSYYQEGGRTRYTGHDNREILENDRIELLRKLDELKDQLSRSCDVADKPKDTVGPDPTMVPVPPNSHVPYDRYHTAYIQENMSGSHGNKQLLAHDHPEAPYQSHTHGFLRYTDHYDSSGREPYRGYTHEFTGYAHGYHPRPPQPYQYMHRPYHGRYPGFYGDVTHDPFVLHPNEIFFHQPACSCVHCYNKNWHLPPNVDPPGSHHQRSKNEPSSHNFHGHLNPIPQGPQVYSSGGSKLYPLHSRQSIAKNSSDMESENDSFNYHRSRKVVPALKSGRVWYPIAGGAPFISCSSCFELLKLPRRYISLVKTEQKMKCGACSSTIVFDLGSKGFVVSASIRIDQVPTEIDNGSGGTADENVPYWQADSNSADMNACSKEYDDSQSKFLPTDEISNSGESEKQLDPHSPTSSLSEDEQNPEKMPSEKHASPSAELPPAEVPSLPIPDLSSQECQNNSTDNIVSSRFDKGNKSKRSEPERIAPDRTRSRQSSVKDGAVATEMDVSLNEFSNSGVSLDSVEISREHQPKTNKGGDSFFAGLIKKSFRDFKKSNQGVEAGVSQVFVNGHFIPDRVVKKAEKLAGPIQPGEYWYDSTAGFWGVMGHPCLGIVMPNIEEFDYPMPEKCAAGNTGVYVNGRELNQKDLDLLASRGLPITRHRSYIIEISGKVIDEDTGEELDGLGKLAPTVERANHGFGMKVPRFIAQLHN